MLSGGSEIKGCSTFYNEPYEIKLIITSEGTNIEVRDSKPDFYTTVYAKEPVGGLFSHTESIGGLAGFEFLKTMNNPLEIAETTKTLVKEFFMASKAPTGEQVVILDPTMVGLIVHEAIGHLAEADFVLAGSAFKDKLGKKISSDLITIVDSGNELGSGWLPVDDEGVKTTPVTIIDKGTLSGFLHTRSSAAEMNQLPTGNARANEFDDLPLVRMRNTFISPSKRNAWKREEIISDTKTGILLAGDGEGSADSTSEFMFTALKPYLINNGEIKSLLKPCTITGIGFEVLNMVDAVGDNWSLKMGNGSCAKMQPIKVDGGGPTIRTKCLVSS
ncbi:MAG: TldD/PmbA family protein, partial [Candidatus Thorarchaeota archaeon]